MRDIDERFQRSVALYHCGKAHSRLAPGSKS